MIRRAQDYQYVTPVGVIDGGILPAREVAADGSAHVLRAEDLCFSIEAVLERQSVGNMTPIATLPTPKIVVDRKDWTPLWYELSRVFPGADYYVRSAAIDPNEQFAEQDFSDDGTLDELFPGCFLSSRYMSGTFPPNVWNNDFVRGFYFDLSRSDLLRVPWSSWPVSGTLTRTYHDEDGSSTTSETVNQFTINARMDYANRTGGPYGWKRRFNGYTGGSMTFTLPKYQRALSAELFVLEDILSSSYDTGTRYVYRFRKHQLTWSASGVVTIPDAAWKRTESDLVALAAEFGIKVPVTTSSQQVANSVINVLDARRWLVVNYNFHTEIRSLNWQWTP